MYFAFAFWNLFSVFFLCLDEPANTRSDQQPIIIIVILIWKLFLDQSQLWCCMLTNFFLSLYPCFYLAIEQLAISKQWASNEQYHLTNKVERPPLLGIVSRLSELWWAWFCLCQSNFILHTFSFDIFFNSKTKFMPASASSISSFAIRLKGAMKYYFIMFHWPTTIINTNTKRMDFPLHGIEKAKHRIAWHFYFYIYSFTMLYHVISIPASSSHTSMMFLVVTLA